MVAKNTQSLKKRKSLMIFKDVRMISGSRWNDKRVQFKRKKNTVAYRINPEDVTKSLIKPSDFTYLNQPESADFLDNWKSLKVLRTKPFKNKRFKPYREEN